MCTPAGSPAIFIWETPYTGWTDTVKADLAYNNAYWAQFQDSVVQTVSNQVYDGLLKAYGDERGIQSYGTVVDLLVAYYRDLAQEKP